MIEQEYKGTFLNQFKEIERFYVTNLFIWAYRGGDWAVQRDGDNSPNLSHMLRRIEQDVSTRLRSSYFNRPLHEQILSILNDEETHSFARFIVERRKSIKPTTVSTYQQKAKSVKPPSEKQLGLLRKLGEKRIPASMQEASDWIEAKV